ncbi:MAG: hypothetical protein Q4D14_04880 [Bacteroidales bacterium]|nr:hypothetical protein [Bacteroidales bacterium]
MRDEIEYASATQFHSGCSDCNISQNALQQHNYQAMYTTPILLITFNRPRHTQRVLEVIMQAKPKDLYVFQDGARDGNENDAIRCKAVREVVKTLTDNTATVLHTNYSSKNLGCGAGPMTGISWFFDNVEQGIVMEDDCLAHPDFFGYCEEMLQRYKDNPQVMFINSTLYNNRWQCRESYGFSRYMVTGAWASWREVWQGFDLDLHTLNANAFFRHVNKLTHNVAEAEWWWYKVKEIQRDQSKKSYWDYQMQIHLFRKDAITIHPKVNLVSNIGFDTEGTHTLNNNDGRGDRPIYGIFPLIHPNEIKIDWRQDSYYWAKKPTKGWLNDWAHLCYHIIKWKNRR